MAYVGPARQPIGPGAGTVGDAEVLVLSTRRRIGLCVQKRRKNWRHGQRCWLLHGEAFIGPKRLLSQEIGPSGRFRGVKLFFFCPLSPKSKHFIMFIPARMMHDLKRRRGTAGF
jgi:hypothetical protein